MVAELRHFRVGVGEGSFACSWWMLPPMEEAQEMSGAAWSKLLGGRTGM